MSRSPLTDAEERALAQDVEEMLRTMQRPRTLTEIAHEVLGAAAVGATPALAKALQDLDVIVVVGRGAEEAGGESSSAGAIAPRPGRDGSSAYMALVMQGLCGLIDGDLDLLGRVVAELTAQVETDARAVELARIEAGA